MGTETNGFQLLKDSTIVMKNGTINIDPSNLTAPSTNESKPIKRIIQSYADLTLEKYDPECRKPGMAGRITRLASIMEIR